MHNEMIMNMTCTCVQASTCAIQHIITNRPSLPLHVQSTHTSKTFTVQPCNAQTWRRAQCHCESQVRKHATFGTGYIVFSANGSATTLFGTVPEAASEKATLQRTPSPISACISPHLKLHSWLHASAASAARKCRLSHLARPIHATHAGPTQSARGCPHPSQPQWHLPHHAD